MEHFYQDVPGFFWFEHAYKLLLATLPADRPSTFVEIGAYKGRSTAWLGVEILNSGKPVTLHVVDSWECPNGETGQGPAIRAEFEQNVAPLAAALNGRFHVHAQLSAEAAASFPDDSADVVWMDGDHEYDSIKADIAAWWPKLRVGGFMGGDDFLMFSVAKAVCEFFAPRYLLCHGWTELPIPMPWPSWFVRKLDVEALAEPFV
jgi:hypothetical protein